MKSLLLPAAVLASLSSPAPAQTPKLLKDINTRAIPTPSNARPILPASFNFIGQRDFTRLGKHDFAHDLFD